MNVLLTGAGGQLGRELCERVPAGARLSAFTRGELDITDAAAVREAFAARRPDVVINAAAYTNVEKAEDEETLAQQVNGEGPALIAQCCRDSGARLIHISTDYVFDGRRAGAWETSAATGPINAYGRSKLQGETAVQRISKGDAVVIRTSWVYSRHGSNFVLKMLELAQTREQLDVVSDQVGSPTWAGTLAEGVWRFAARPALKGIWHFSDCGAASWYDFSAAIFEEATAMDLLARPVRVRPLLTRDWPTRAQRPLNSVLDTSQTWQALEWMAPHWRASLRTMLAGLKAAAQVPQAAGGRA